ncbi:MAG TPA: hypothetical protein ENN86_01465, partial [Desulfobacteraceae bacterium]|nr:hypothetical protein [Desulfobacteraceae bacterium]
MRNVKQNKSLWILTAFLALISSLIGVFNPAVYDRVVDRSIMAGVYSQDLTAIAAALLVIILAVSLKDKDFKKVVVILGLLGFLFYGYGIYAIERIYNSLYYLYLAIFSLSFYSIIYSVLSFVPDLSSGIKMPSLMRYVSIFFLFFIPVMFGFLWISELMKLIASAEKIEFLYSVYILDLCFIMPAFVITGYKT